MMNHYDLCKNISRFCFFSRFIFGFPFQRTISYSASLIGTYSKECIEKLKTNISQNIETNVINEVQQYFDYYVCMIQRPMKMKSFAGLSTFPGGKMEMSDFREAVNFRHLSPLRTRLPENIMKKLSVQCYQDDIENSLKITALRETFEETGQLLFSSNQIKHHCEALIISQKNYPEIFIALSKNPHLFTTLYSQLKLSIPLSNLKLWSNWTSPLTLKYRFNTSMFHAHVSKASIFDDKLKGFKLEKHDSTNEKEIDKIHFAMPSDYLQNKTNLISRKPTMAPPQYYEMQRLCNYPTINQLISHIENILEKKMVSEFRNVPCEYKDESGEIRNVWILTGDKLFSKTSTEYFLKPESKYNLSSDEYNQKYELNRVEFHQDETQIFWNCNTVVDGHKPPISLNEFNRIFK